MTNELDALYKPGRRSAQFIAAARPIESAFVESQNRLPQGEPRDDLFVNIFEAYRQTAVAMIATSFVTLLRHHWTKLLGFS